MHCYVSNIKYLGVLFTRGNEKKERQKRLPGRKGTRLHGTRLLFFCVSSLRSSITPFFARGPISADLKRRKTREGSLGAFHPTHLKQPRWTMYPIAAVFLSGKLTCLAEEVALLCHCNVLLWPKSLCAALATSPIITSLLPLQMTLLILSLPWVAALRSFLCLTLFHPKWKKKRHKKAGGRCSKTTSKLGMLRNATTFHGRRNHVKTSKVSSAVYPLRLSGYCTCTFFI